MYGANIADSGGDDRSTSSPNSLCMLFLYSAQILLAVAGTAKLYALLGHDGILRLEDPVLGIPNRVLLGALGGTELAACGIISVVRDKLPSYLLTLWLGVNFITYRIFLWSGHYLSPCPCLGSLTRKLHIDQKNADRMLFALACYLVLASGICLWIRFSHITNAATSTVKCKE
jgi:hypothetical protein